jgi:hypothetical protein
MLGSDEIAAREERVNEAVLDAERIYWLIVEDEEFGIDLVRSFLRLSAEIRELQTHNRVSEVSR